MLVLLSLHGPHGLSLLPGKNLLINSILAPRKFNLRNYGSFVGIPGELKASDLIIHTQSVTTGMVGPSLLMEMERHRPDGHPQPQQRKLVMEAILGPRKFNLHNYGSFVGMPGKPGMIKPFDLVIDPSVICHHRNGRTRSLDEDEASRIWKWKNCPCYLALPCVQSDFTRHARGAFDFLLK